MQMTHALRRTGERVLVADALIRLVGLSFDDVGHRVFGTQAVHDLLRRVVRVIDERPRDVAEEATLWQLFHRLTRLFFFIQFKFWGKFFYEIQLEMNELP